MIKVLSSVSRLDWLVLGLALVLGIGLRLYPGPDHIIWTYDQARDVFRSRNIIAQGDLKLVGPQTEFVGLSHGPLHYYLWSPFLSLAKGDPNLTVDWMIIWNLSTLLPLAWLSQVLFKNKKITYLTVFLFVLAYQQVEYSRWLSNVSVAIPFLAWTYYFLWQTLNNKKLSFWLGLSLGLAIQGEVFLLYLIPVIYLFLWVGRVKLSSWYKFHLGLATGGMTFIITELKFGFLGVRTFMTEFLGGHLSGPVEPAAGLKLYLNHWGLVVQQNIVGLTGSMAVWLLIVSIVWVTWFSSGVTRTFLNKHRLQVKFLLFLLVSHSILFVFHAIDAVFLDLSILVPLYVLVAVFIAEILKHSQLWFALIMSLVVISQLGQLITNTRSHTPFAAYNFSQEGFTFSQKLEIAEAMYQLADEDQPFSLSVLGTPYGVRTVWASVFEQVGRRTGRPLPLWHGFTAQGYEGDELLVKTDHPLANHILLIESNQTLLDQYARDLHLEHQNSVTELVAERELYGYKIQLRKPIADNQE